MNSHSISCPYCGESLEISVDPSVRRQEYIEDCQVCCKPIVLTVMINEEEDVSVETRTEDE